MQRLLHSLLAVLAIPFLASVASSTWSIVIVNRATGEVCCATATCVSGINIKEFVPVIVVGKGAAATQNVVPQIPKRRLIRDGLLYDGTPQRILDEVLDIDLLWQTRQYGIASFTGPAVTFTGSTAGEAHPAVTGTFGDLEYAIQGNVLAGDMVVYAAETAMLQTDGDLATRVMAGMEAARFYGGDGRCSCSFSSPTGCGSPPASFNKSAHTACIVLARLGDIDGVCTVNQGCASGQYYLCETTQGGGSAPDAVITLQRKVDVWRANLAGVPDHILTEVRSSAPQLMADGLSSSLVRVRLVDVDGTPLTVGGQTLTVTDVSSGIVVATAGTVQDLGNGTHEFTVSATQLTGSAQFQIEVMQGTRVVRLYPDLELDVQPVAELHVGRSELSSSLGQALPLIVSRAQDSGAPYRILASASGTVPGTPFGSGTIPLNDDSLYQWTLLAHPILFPGGHGTLDSGGRAEAFLLRTASLTAPFIGTQLNFCAAIGAADPYYFTNTTAVSIVP